MRLVDIRVVRIFSGLFVIVRYVGDFLFNLHGFWQ